MGIYGSLEKRRSVYGLGRELPEGVTLGTVLETVRKVARIVPDAFNMKSQRAIVVGGSAQDRLWDAIYGAFDGKLDRSKADSFKAGAGTVLFFTDKNTVSSMQEQQPRYAGKFDQWSQHSIGMLQICIWTALRDLGLGASLQHYNPVIDEVVREITGAPKSWELVAQMPFGSIVQEPDPKDRGDINERVKAVID